MKVRISRTIADEYVSRCVWEHDEWKGFPDQPGVHEVDEATATQMRQDAEFQANPQDGPDLPAPTRRAYRTLAQQLLAG